MSLNTTTFQVSLNSGETNTFGNVVANEAVLHSTASGGSPLTNGASSGQAQRAQQVQAATSTTPATINLQSLAGGLDGATRTYTSIKALIFENLDPTNTITITQGATNPWTGFGGTTYSLTVEPGAVIALYSPVNGITVGASNCNFRVTAGAGTPSYKLSLVGLGT